MDERPLCEHLRSRLGTNGGLSPLHRERRRKRSDNDYPRAIVDSIKGAGWKESPLQEWIVVGEMTIRWEVRIFSGLRGKQGRTVFMWWCRRNMVGSSISMYLS